MIFHQYGVLNGVFSSRNLKLIRYAMLRMQCSLCNIPYKLFLMHYYCMQCSLWNISYVMYLCGKNNWFLSWKWYSSVWCACVWVTYEEKTDAILMHGDSVPVEGARVSVHFYAIILHCGFFKFSFIPLFLVIWSLFHEFIHLFLYYEYVQFFTVHFFFHFFFYFHRIAVYSRWRSVVSTNGELYADVALP